MKNNKNGRKKAYSYKRKEIQICSGFDYKFQHKKRKEKSSCFFFFCFQRTQTRPQKPISFCQKEFFFFCSEILFNDGARRTNVKASASWKEIAVKILGRQLFWRMKKTKNWKWEKRPRRARRHNLATTSDTTLEIPKSNLMLKKMWKESGGEKKNEIPGKMLPFKI